jgi:hypothetical protein
VSGLFERVRRLLRRQIKELPGRRAERCEHTHNRANIDVVVAVFDALDRAAADLNAFGQIALCQLVRSAQRFDIRARLRQTATAWERRGQRPIGGYAWRSLTDSPR